MNSTGPNLLLLDPAIKRRIWRSTASSNQD
jgi:hypothetical protein